MTESSNAVNRRVSYSQLESLWEALNTRREIALGYNKSAQAREFARRMWEEVAITLNSQGGGAIKDGKGWSKYWNDYKSKLKKLIAKRNSSARQTGGGPPQGSHLSEIEEKFLQILGINYGQGLPGARVEPFEEVPLAGQEVEMERLEDLADDTAATPSAQPRPASALLTPPAQPLILSINKTM